MVKRVLRFGAGAVLAAALAVPVVLLPLPSYAADVTISMIDFDYQPENRSVKPGDRIRWTNTGQSTHTVTFTSGPDIDVEVGPGDTSDYITFTQQGTFRYYCRFHGTPEGGGMSGTVKVTTGSTASPAPSPTGSGTRTITIGPSPRPTRSRTRTASPRQTSASPSPSPTPTTATPTPTPTETFITESATPIPTITEDETGSSGNSQALIAVGVVLGLGILGFLIYRRTLAP